MTFRILNLRALMALAGILLPWSALATTITVPVPCTNSVTATPAPSGSPVPGAGLRQCQDVIYAPATAPTPGLLSMISNNVTDQSKRGTIQKYADCYYKGFEMDGSNASVAITAGIDACKRGNPTPVHNMCSIVPNRLNNNTSEGSSSSPNNVAGISCGTPATISVAILNNCPTPTLPNPSGNVPSPTASEASFLAQKNLTVSDVMNMNTDSLKVLQSQAGISSQRADQLTGKEQACISIHLANPSPGQPDPSWERNQFAGGYILSLESNTDEVLNEMSCHQSLAIDSNSSCAYLAKEIQGLNNQMSTLSAQLLSAANIGDIDFCKSSFDPGNSMNSDKFGSLRQSATILCSARARLEAAFNQLALCDIFARTQVDFYSKTGNYANQQAFMTKMGVDMDNTCRPGCKGSKSTASLGNCLQSCYKANYQNYFSTKLQSSQYWPQPTSLDSSCVAGGKVYVGN